MKYHIEIEDRRDFDVLADFQVMQAIESMTKIVYSQGVANLIIDTMKREKDRTKLLEMARELYTAYEKLDDKNRLPIVIFDSVRNQYGDISVSTPFPLQKKLEEVNAPADVIARKEVPSSSRPGHYHQILYTNGIPTHCSCEGFYFSKEKTGQGTCRHMREALR